MRIIKDQIKVNLIILHCLLYPVDILIHLIMDWAIFISQNDRDDLKSGTSCPIWGCTAILCIIKVHILLVRRRTQSFEWISVMSLVMHHNTFDAITAHVLKSFYPITRRLYIQDVFIIPTTLLFQAFCCRQLYQNYCSPHIFTNLIHRQFSDDLINILLSVTRQKNHHIDFELKVFITRKC